MNRRRSAARRRALQALYQWQMAGQNLADIEAQFFAEMNMEEVDQGLFRALLHGVPTQVDTLDARIAPLLDRPVAQLDPVERAVLRLGLFELQEHLDVPYKVIITEAVELTKAFGGTDSHKYVNGVLDKLARANTFRAAERQAGGGE
ncbi:transcription antitermination factor NusB [Alkalilimnicola sp. S0819]|nr:transcription antitermination factor NusB [Alkalilimnicola sp. S0819]MPQ17253.1 transcription antitermination factor NusB [Alkalilimnicola sp. S0819]